MVDLMGSDTTCNTCTQQGLDCYYGSEGIFCAKIYPTDAITISCDIEHISTHLHELGDEMKEFSNMKPGDKIANDVLNEMELTLQFLGQDIRDLGKKVSNEKDYILSEHFWSKTAGYFEGLSDAVHRINTGIKQYQNN